MNYIVNVIMYYKHVQKLKKKKKKEEYDES